MKFARKIITYWCKISASLIFSGLSVWKYYKNMQFWSIIIKSDILNLEEFIIESHCACYNVCYKTCLCSNEWTIESVGYSKVQSNKNNQSDLSTLLVCLEMSVLWL